MRSTPAPPRDASSSASWPASQNGTGTLTIERTQAGLKVARQIGRIGGLTCEDIQIRVNRWVIADLRGKGGRIHTVAIPVWVKKGIDAWRAAASIEEGPLLRSISKGSKVGESLSDWTI